MEKNSGSMNSILFVCTGNTCRSVMAEGYLKHFLAEDSKIEVSSAGIIPYWSGRANELTIEVMKEEGIDVSNHRTKGIDRKTITHFDLILTMSRLQRDNILSQFPGAAGKIFCFKEYVYQETAPDLMEIRDPFAGEREDYLAVAGEIKKAVQALLDII